VTLAEGCGADATCALRSQGGEEGGRCRAERPRCRGGGRTRRAVQPLPGSLLSRVEPRARGPWPPVLTRSTTPQELLNSIPDFAELGQLFKSSSPIQLTEDEAEYQVNVVKHVYPKHVVLQFNVINNMPDHQLENVSVDCNMESEWQVELLVPEAKLATNASGASS
jgi:hypothetical protein